MDPNSTLSMTAAPVLQKEHFKTALIELIHEKITNTQNIVSPSEKMVCRIAVDIPSIHLSGWLKNQQHDRKFYFCSRDKNNAFASVASCMDFSEVNNADMEKYWAKIQETLQSSDAGVRAVGGFQFDAFFKTARKSGSDSIWKKYPNVFFYIPRMEISKNKNRYTFAVNMTQKDLCDKKTTDQIVSMVHQISIDDVIQEESISVSSRTDLPDYSNWKHQLYRASKQFSENTLEKVVLARRTSFFLKSEFKKEQLLIELEKKSKNSFLFYFQMDQQTAFTGKSPELFLKIENHSVQTEAVAGNRPVADHAGPETFSLLQSQKELQEHNYVQRGISETLRMYCTEINEANRLSIVDLSHVKHLYKPYQATLKESGKRFQLLMSLHPTPALGGLPAPEANKFIAENEPFERGFYGAPFGYIEKNTMEMAVAIRSALVLHEEIHFFAGAGITRDTNTDSEWLELEQKLENFFDFIEVQ